MNLQSLPAAEVCKRLRSRETGLTAEEAAARLAEFGSNEVSGPARRSLVREFLGEFVHFFALLLWVAAGLAFIAARHDPASDMAALGYAILGVIVVNGAFSFVQRYRAERALDELKKLLPTQVTLLRAGTPTEVAAGALVPGDVVLLEAGMRVPADCRLIAATGLRLDYATVTGESAPVERTAHPVGDARHESAANLVLAGTYVVSGEARGVVFATGMQTEFGRIARLAQAAPETVTPLQREIAHLSRLVALFALGLGLLFFIVSQRMGLPAWTSWLFAIGVIVANVPEGLLPTLTLALAMAAQRMAKRNALVCHLPAVEALGATSVICTDKTGTLTANRMRVAAVWLDGTLYRDAWPPSPVFWAALRHCHDLKILGDGSASGDPTEIALVEAAGRFPTDDAAAQRVDELTFDSERKRLAVLVARGTRRMLYVKGALEPLLPRLTALRAGGETRSLQTADSQRISDAHDALADQGMRILAVASRAEPGSDRATWESHLVFEGLVGLADPPRPEVAAAVAECRSAGIRVVMLTGDHPLTARSIARQVGMVGASAHAVTGEQLIHLTDAQLQLLLDTPDLLFARVTPEQKTAIVAAFKRKGHVVAVTGDGVNDAPALRTADIGIAMGRTGTDVARAAADIVLLDDNFASIVSAVREGRTVFANIRKFLTYILTSNVPELVPYLAFVLLGVPLPLTIIQILLVDLGTDLFPALALGAEPPHENVMHQPPRKKKSGLLTGRLLSRSYLFLGPVQAAGAMSAYFFVLHRDTWQAATTATFATIVVTQMFNLFACRSAQAFPRPAGFGANPWLAPALLFEAVLLLTLVYTPVGRVFAGMAPFPATTWLVMLPFGALLWVTDAVEKRFRRDRSQG